MHQLCEEADARCAQACQDPRRLEPSLHVDSLKHLAASDWFDEHLLACGYPPHVKDFTSKLREQYEAFCKRCKDKAIDSLKAFIYLGPEDRLLGSQAEAVLFQEFADVLKQLSFLGGEVPKMAEHVQVFNKQCKKLLADWQKK
eukprot:3861385-Rhodomonas_salina.1